MQAGRGDADDRVAALHRFLAVQYARFFHDADNGATDVVFTFLVKARHLSRFTSDERTTVFRARPREALDDFGEDVRFEFAGAEVIEEEQRLGAEHGEGVARIKFIKFQTKTRY